MPSKRDRQAVILELIESQPVASQEELRSLLPQLVTAVEGVSELLVVRTSPGSAQAVAKAMDTTHLSDVIGTIAGDDTILIVCRSLAARERLERRLAADSRKR